MMPFTYKPTKLNPNTRFINCPDSIKQYTVCDFWQWAFSDLLQNTTRGILAEYIVALLLGNDCQIRNPWSAYDLKLADGQNY